jgi:hypothetical protein
LREISQRSGAAGTPARAASTPIATLPLLPRFNPRVPTQPDNLPMALTHFHPAVADWFDSQFAAPTPAQQAAWAAIRRGRHALVAAPTTPRCTTWSASC